MSDSLGWWNYKHMSGGWTGLEVTIINCASLEEAYDFIEAWHVAQGEEYINKDDRHFKKEDLSKDRWYWCDE